MWSGTLLGHMVSGNLYVQLHFVILKAYFYLFIAYLSD